MEGNNQESELIQNLKKYLNNVSPEQFEKDWEEVKLYKESISTQLADNKIMKEIDEKEPVLSGWKRQWYKCSKCSGLQYRDYIPYSFSNPILTTRCGHSWSDLKEC